MDFQARSRKFLLQGVAGGNFDEGFASLNFGLLPGDAAEAGKFRFWYDRHIGTLNPVRSDDQLFDAERAGTVWSAIFYDDTVVPVDPSGVDPVLLVDDHGFHFFRQRWQDENDLQFGFHADVEALNHAWDRAEVGAFSMLGFGNMLAGGPSAQRP